jgi:hypothetical protein
MLERIAEEGEAILDAFLEHEQDREVLYHRLQRYREFAEAYDCPLDRAGGMAGERIFELAPNRYLRFVGLNSALCCSKNDALGKLLLGAKQRVLPRNRGEELVVLCHHPLPWFRDSDDARRYIRSRARIFVSGHEHSPRLNVEPVAEGCDLLTLEAGATVPPVESEQFTFTYNVVEFDWDTQSDGLKVIVHPRIWSGKSTSFEANTLLPGAKKPFYILGCPNFRSAKPHEPIAVASGKAARPGVVVTVATAPSLPVVRPEIVNEGGTAMSDEFPLLLLRFFRDLTGAQRLAVLIRIGALPEDWTEPLSHSMERTAID